MSLFLGILLSSMAVGDPGSESQPLTVDGVAHSVQHAELSMRVETETFDAASQSWVYGRNPTLVLALEVRVDDRSGEDGALSPDLYFHLPNNAPAELSGFVLDEKEHQVEAWYGNDAPALENNRLEIKSELNAGPVKVLWNATSARGSKLVFDGPVEFMGISLKVKNVTDVDGYLRKVWPALDLSRLELVSESEIDFGEDWPEERRHWMELHYDFKPRLE